MASLTPSKLRECDGKGFCYLLLSTLYNSFAHTSKTYNLVLKVVKENCMTADLCNVAPVFTEIGGD